MKSKTQWQLVLAVIAVVLGVALSLQPQEHHRRAVNPPGSPTNLPFSNGIIVGNTLYVAGEQGLDASGKLRPGGIEPETQATLENIRKIVEAAGFKMSDVVTVNVYIADVNEFGSMNKVYKTFFPDPKPTRTTVQVARLINDARVEISAVAMK